MSVAGLGSKVEFTSSGTSSAGNELTMARLQTPSTVSAANGTTQPPGLVPVHIGRKTVVVPSTKPQPPPTFQPTTDHSSIIKMPYVGPVYYTNAGSLSRPLQDLGRGALVNINT